jgi:DNA mismatch repair protein MutS
VLDEEQLDARSGWYLAALAAGAPGEPLGLAWLDVSTGEFCAAEVAEAALGDELARIGPREILVAPELPEGPVRQALAWLPVARSAAPPAEPGSDRALLQEVLADGFAELGLEALPRVVSAAAACVRYARSTQPGGALPIARLLLSRPTDHLVIDEATQRNLELFETLAERKRRGSLLAVLDETGTAPGARLLRRWLSAPLLSVARIRRRLDAVEWLVEHALLRARLREELRLVHDLERLVGRVLLGVAAPRDLVALRGSLERLPTLRAALVEAAGHDLAPPELLRLGLAGSAAAVDLGQDVAGDVAAALIDDPPAQWKEGGYLRRGFHPEFDQLSDIATGGKDAILAMELRERERTGIGSLKIRYNRVFGFYIEITRSNLGRVPDGDQRKQTLANAERYITDELIDYERRVLGAEERRLVIEEEQFLALRQRVAAQAGRLQALAEQVAVVDVLVSLAEVAHRGGYVRPEIDDGLHLSIEEGRHPVVEQLVGAGGFVPNDVCLDPDDAQLVVITGPNMAGKSTVMRQVALIQLLAQTGSFVPARRARLGLVDRVFTRVGASDNLGRGESTFMVEMRETAAILRHASRRSLVVLDEIGRGTSTYDGLSIAWAVAEYLHDRVGAKTMFATHYHELTALARTRPRVRNQHVAVREWTAPARPEAAAGRGDSEVVFLHKLVDGGASRSYGIQVARLAGLPRPVLERAREVLRTLESGEEASGRAALLRSPQLSLFASAPAPAPGPPAAPPSTAERRVLEALRAADVDGLSPRQALALLAELRARLADEI